MSWMSSYTREDLSRCLEAASASGFWLISSDLQTHWKVGEMTNSAKTAGSSGISVTSARLSLRSRADWVLWTFGVMAATCALIFAMEIAAAGGNLELATRFSWIYDLQVFGLFVCAATFITWHYRAHANLRLLGRDNVAHSDQATIWWWIVPFAFFVVPFRVAFETVRGSMARRDDVSWQRSTLDPSAPWWAGLFVGGMLGARAASTMFGNASTLSEARQAVWVSAASALVLAAAAVAVVIMVSRVTDSQMRLLGEPWGQRGPDHGFELESGDSEAKQTATGMPQPLEESRGALYCSRCGTRFTGGDRFCASCGRARP